MEHDELFEDLFPDELRHEQVQDMRQALERRLAAAESGALPSTEAERQEMAQHIALLKQEEVIADFVEESMAKALLRRRLLDAIGESDSE